MGFLTDGTPLSWVDSLKHIEYVREHGITQFLHMYEMSKDRVREEFLWGDEIEYLLFEVDKAESKVNLCLKAHELLKKLKDQNQQEQKVDSKRKLYLGRFLPEFGNFMIEGTPSVPYGNRTADLRRVEVNMRLRRKLIESHLLPNERVLSVTNFFLLGADGSDLDKVVSPHPRFLTLAHNIRDRRGGKVDIRIPLYKDPRPSSPLESPPPSAQSAQSFLSPLSPPSPPSPSGSPPLSLPSSPSSPPPPPPPPGAVEKIEIKGLPEIKSSDGKSILMDHMAYGMGSGCLQVTFQCRSIGEARHLYDQLAVVAPLMLAMTAATPFCRGHIADTDVRWSMICQSVDDRTPFERGEESEQNGVEKN